MQKLAKVAIAGVASSILLGGTYGLARYIQKKRSQNGVHEPEELSPKAKKSKKKAKNGKKLEVKLEKKKTKKKDKKGKKK